MIKETSKEEPSSAVTEHFTFSQSSIVKIGEILLGIGKTY